MKFDHVRSALTQLEKIFGRIQSAWTPATGFETFEIIRRRLFQELGEDGERAREQSVKAFASYYKNNAGEFPAEVRDKAYEEQIRAAYRVSGLDPNTPISGASTSWRPRPMMAGVSA